MIDARTFAVALLVTGCAAPPQRGSSVQRTVTLGSQKAGGGTPAPAMPNQNVPAIKVDTVGYPTKWRKIAIFNVEPKNPVVKNAAGAVALEIAADKIEARGLDPASQDQVWQVDFSALEKPGTYIVEQGLEGGGAKSDPFVIGDGIYDEALLAAQKMFYFQRTRTALEKPFAVWKGEAFTRAKPSHVHGDVGWDLTDYPDKKRKWKVEAGWHDAGNYDMYVPATAPTAQTLLIAYEWSPAAFDDKKLVNPESGNGVPDILDEARWGLTWVLSVQEENGAFRHREAVMESSPEVPADQDTSVRWIAGISTAATAKAVAVLAMAARVYAPFDKEFAKRCEQAAKKGWAWLGANKERVLVDGKGADQPLWDDEPGNTDTGAQFAAAVEMWRSFRDDGALGKVQQLMASPETQPDQFMKGAWANISRWGLGTLAVDEKTPKALRTEARQRILAGAALVRKQIESADGYRCASTLEDYYWASNSQLLEKTHILALAARLDPSQHWYTEAARDQWHWILGRNPIGYSMVTRIGKGPDRIYHMEWGHKEPPPPGYLVGGPNGQEASFLAPGAPAKAILWDNPRPLRSGLPPHSLWHWQQTDLWDGGFLAEEDYTQGWWTVVEPDIIYNANLVLAAVALR